VAVGDAGSILTSPDGISWTSRTSGVAGRIDGVSYKGNRFVVTSTSESKSLVSLDGLAWVVDSYDPYVGGQIVQGAGKFVSFRSPNEIATSTDGITWSITLTALFDLRGLAWNGRNLSLLVFAVVTARLME
jgi:hypothetical protein